jgi:3-phosphoshikimate 1-carboxyvinyltransferase
VSPPREVVVRVPGSKSAAIRALVAAALARGTSRIAGAPGSGDVRAVVGALRALGVRVEGRAGRGTLVVRGTAGRLPPGDRRLDLGGSATGLRILACVAALREGRTVLTGDASLRRRPAGPLEAPLRALGVRVATRRGRPPVVLAGGPARIPERPVPVDAGTTSQVASGLLLCGVPIRLEGPAVSAPYLALTRAVLRRFRGAGTRAFAVEADWSSAAYPLVAAAILGRSVRVPGLDPRSLQADRAVIPLLRRAGVRCGADSRGAWCRGTGRVLPFAVDLRGAPDLAPAAAALALFAEGTSRVTGAAHLREKESDRIAACVAAARALGARARPLRDGFEVRGGTLRAGTVDSRGDHRIALAFGVAAAAIPRARVRDRGCTAKSWPGAWRALAPLLR